MRYLWAISLLFLSFTTIGCIETKDVTSDILVEKATVSDLVYSPRRHDLKLVPTSDFEGNIGLDVDLVEVPEKWTVVFHCQHGGFTVERKELFERLKKSQEAYVYYKEIYRETYEDRNGDGKRELIKRVLVDYDFIDASLEPRKPEAVR